uniref:HMA domain-containing protein n=1 Tax=Oryza meridionalis TaxID=40149 RepID=A0A0E0DQN6_9ORYZ
MRARYEGRWVCGLSADAINDQELGCASSPISPVEAVDHHAFIYDIGRVSTVPPSVAESVDGIFVTVLLLLCRRLGSLLSARRRPQYTFIGHFPFFHRYTFPSSMASESLQCKVLALRVSIHCEECKKKVKKVLQKVEGVYRCDVDGRSNKATVTVTGKVSADTLVRKLRRAGKHAEQWPEEQQQQQQPGGGQCPEETKNQAAELDKSGEPAEPEKPASGDAAEPSDTKVTHEEPKKVAGEGAAAVAPADDGGTEITDANVSESAADGGGGGGVETVTAQQPNEPKRRRKQQQQQEEKAGEVTMATAAAAAAASTQGNHTSHHFPAAPLQQQPVHVMSYNVARPSSSAAYYAAAPPASAARPPPPLPPPPPPQEHSYAYSPYYTQTQPSPYRYGGYYSYYYYGGGGGGQRTPQRSAASPARNSYGDLFSDDNANSCSVMRAPAAVPAWVTQEGSSSGQGAVTAADSRRIVWPHITSIRARYERRWVCGLCADAIDEELGCASSPISLAEAVDHHAFVRSIGRVSTVPPSAAESADGIFVAVLLLLRRRLGSLSSGVGSLAALPGAGGIEMRTIGRGRGMRANLRERTRG